MDLQNVEYQIVIQKSFFVESTTNYFVYLHQHFETIDMHLEIALLRSRQNMLVIGISIQERNEGRNNTIRYAQIRVCRYGLHSCSFRFDYVFSRFLMSAQIVFTFHLHLRWHWDDCIYRRLIRGLTVIRISKARPKTLDCCPQNSSRSYSWFCLQSYCVWKTIFL